MAGDLSHAARYGSARSGLLRGRPTSAAAREYPRGYPYQAVMIFEHIRRIFGDNRCELKVDLLHSVRTLTAVRGAHVCVCDLLTPRPSSGPEADLDAVAGMAWCLGIS